MHDFVKASGARSTKEFLSRYPSEELFFRDYPMFNPNRQLNVEQNQSLPGDHSVENSLKNVTETFKRGGTNRKAPANSTIIPVGPNPEMKKGGNYTWDASTNSSYELGGEIEEYKSGGIHINPANKGKFNATKKATGKTTEELTHSKNPVTRKRAIFAQNAAKWHHEMGGMIPKFQNGLWNAPPAIPQDVTNGYKMDNSWKGLMKDPIAQQQMKPQQNLPGVSPTQPTNQPQFNSQQDFSQNDIYNSPTGNSNRQTLGYLSNATNQFLNYGLPGVQYLENQAQNKSRRTTDINNRMTDTMYADPTNPQNSKGDYGIGANNGTFRPNQYTPGRFGQYGGKFQEGGVYDASSDEIAQLKAKGYKIQIL